MNMPVAMPSWMIALIAFVATIMAVAAIGALAEALHILRSRHRVTKTLRDLKSRSLRGIPETAETLLRGSNQKGPKWLHGVLTRLPRIDDLGHFLEQADTRLTVGSFLLFSVGSAAAFGLALTTLGTSSVITGVGAGIGFFLPTLYYRRRRRQRLEKFEEHFPEAIDLLSRTIRAGHALSTGLGMVGEEVGEPVAGEFRQVFEEQKFGLPLEESLRGMYERVPLTDVRILATAVLIQRDVGGNLAEILDKLSGVIRERFTFRRQLRTYTAQGRMTGMVLGVAPFVPGSGCS